MGGWGNTVKMFEPLSTEIKFTVDKKTFEVSVEELPDASDAGGEHGFMVRKIFQQPKTLGKDDLLEDWVDLTQMKRYYEQRFPGRFLKGFASLAPFNEKVELFFRDDTAFVCRWPMIAQKGSIDSYMRFFMQPLLRKD